VKKLDKARLVNNSYTNQAGVEINEINAFLVLVEKKEHRLIKEDDTWILKETHTVMEKIGKEEEANFVGVGTQFFDKTQTTAKQEVKTVDYPADEIDPNDIPF